MTRQHASPHLAGRLLLAAFATLGLTAVLFLGAIYYNNRVNTSIFRHVDQSIDDVVQANDLNRMLVALELDIRALINVILREPYKLGQARENLKAQFREIRRKADAWTNDEPRRKLLEQLDQYRGSLDSLLRHFGEMNSTLYEVYYYINNFNEQLASIQQTVNRLLLEQAVQAKNTDALQQQYVLASIAHEDVLQLHILVNSSVRSSTTALLEACGKSDASGKTRCALEKIDVLDASLRTLTAADGSIAQHAENILETMPLLRENIQNLAMNIANINTVNEEFRRRRDRVLALLDAVNARNRDKILSIEKTVRAHGARSRLVAWLISLVVLAVSALGMVVTRKMARRLEETAADAIRAREKVDSLNTRLQKEVDERRRKADELRRARDELELRVRERTVQLSVSNQSLAAEIEERKKIEYALASEKERLSITLRSIGDGVITTDTDGAVMLINKMAEKMTGWTQAEAIGRPLRDVFHIVHKKSGDTCDNPVDILLRSGAYNMGDDTVLVARDGTRRDISDSCAPIRDRSSRVIGVVLVFRDVTERRRMEEDVLRNEKLKSVGVLAGGIAHDFNNILAAILGNISLVRLHLEQDGHGAESDQLLDNAEKATIRARNLTQQLLTFSKGGEPVRRVESIEGVIRESADFILSGSRTRCRYTIGEDLWPVNIDSGQMSQVIQNIVINALHAMPEGGLLEIRCVNHVHAEPHRFPLAPGRYVRIDIRDEGCGIPEELRDKVFDAYFTTKDEGSGLGLALTHSIISKHQGHITFQSGDWGTCFTIMLPAVPADDAEADPAPRDSLESGAGAKILVMDDEQMVRDIARDMLRYLGHDVETAADGREALEIYAGCKLSETPVDIVIMDLTIPGGMGGRETIDRLREIDPDVRAIVSSGYSNDPVMAEYEKHGFVAMINKPFQLRELADTVREVLSRNQGGKIRRAAE